MKILQILTELGAGGAEKVCLDISKGMLQKNHQVYVISLKSPSFNKTIENDFLQMNIKPQYLCMDSMKQIFLLFKLRKWIKKINPDIVHSHLMHPNLISRLACLGLSIPLINTIHISERRPHQSHFFLMDRLTLSCVSYYTCVSNASARFHEQKLHISKNKIEVIYNGVDPVQPISFEEVQQYKKAWNIEDCTKILGSIGRFDWQKGYDRLFPILEKLSNNEKYAFVLLGDGKQRAELEKYASTLPANIKCVMPGFFPNASSLMTIFDAFIMPSRYEGYGLAFAEAMTLGLPCIVNNIDSLPEIAQNYKNAFVVNFDDIQQSEHIATIIKQALHTRRCDPFVVMSKNDMIEEYSKAYILCTKKTHTAESPQNF